MTKPETRKNTLQRINDLELNMRGAEEAFRITADDIARVEKDHRGAISIITDELAKAKNHIESMEGLWLKPWWKRLFVKVK